MGANDLGPIVSRETEGRFRRFAELVLKWNSRINLVSTADEDKLWERHIADAVDLANLIPSSQAAYADLGSGGGFPGIVVAMMRPNLTSTLVESDGRKAAFLRTVRRQLNLPFDVIEGRIEEIPPLKVDIVSARALASLDRLLGYVERHVVTTGRGFFMKGQSWKAEIDSAERSWTFRAIPHISRLENGGAILEIEQVRRLRNAR